MKYNLFDIRPDFYRKRWIVNHDTTDNTEREDNYKNKGPSPERGIYYYPKSMNSDKAFKRLKNSMIKGYIQKIEGYQKTLNTLKSLKYES